MMKESALGKFFQIFKKMLRRELESFTTPNNQRPLLVEFIFKKKRE
jgi:hypothetical protein